MARTFEDALADATEQWMDEDGVAAVGQGVVDGEPTIDVWVTAAVTRSFPESFEGYRILVHQLGDEIRAQDSASG